MSNIDHHSFKPLPHGLCMVCDGAENEPQHKPKPIETKSDQPEGNDRAHTSNPSLATPSIVAATNAAASTNKNDTPTTQQLDKISNVYSWGEASRLGACKNKYYRNNNEHSVAAIRKKPGTHLWVIHRATHPTSHQVPLEVDQLPKKQEIVLMACSEKHTVLLTESGQVHAFKQQKPSTNNRKREEVEPITRIPLRTQVIGLSCGTAHFVAITAQAKNNLCAYFLVLLCSFCLTGSFCVFTFCLLPCLFFFSLLLSFSSHNFKVCWGLNHVGQLGFAINAHTSKKKETQLMDLKEKNMVSKPTMLDLTGPANKNKSGPPIGSAAAVAGTKKKKKNKKKSWFGGRATQPQPTRKEGTEDDVPPFARVSCGAYSTFAIGSDGKVWSWGYDGFSGCLGRGVLGDVSVPGSRQRRMEWHYAYKTGECQIITKTSMAALAKATDKKRLQLHQSYTPGNF